MIFRNKLPNEIVKVLVDRYESESLFLNKNSEYMNLKKILMSKRKVNIEEFQNFISETKGDEYTYFDYYKIERNFNSNFNSDIKFRKFLYIKFASFLNISNDFINIISETTLPFLIIDLRKNIGGNIDECIKIANSLLPQCCIVNLRYKYKNISYLSDEKFKRFDKIFIFVNEQTMSSSEILALTLKNNLDNVLVLGKKTFGKNIGQSTYVNKKYRYIFNLSTFEWNVNGIQSDNIIDTEINDKFMVLDDYYSIMLSSIGPHEDFYL